MNNDIDNIDIGKPKISDGDCQRPHFYHGQLESSKHPWAGEDLSLKIDERDQTIWNCTIEL